MKSALIVEDHPVVRSMIKLVLDGEGFKRLYEAARGDEVVALVRQHQPDIVLLDLGLPGVPGLDVLERIKAEKVRCKVVVFTALEAQFYQERCMRAGAAAYVSKSKNLDDLKAAVSTVLAGYTCFVQLPSTAVSMNALQRSEKQLIDLLSNRELTILQYLARGTSNTEIADLMHLSYKTVSTYKTRLVLKLNVSSLVHLRDFALRNHLI
ncbi:response regulator transcription factor [Pseudomonas vancouverensis]|uniref:Response regulator transcription factor n=1 Tax=Pseudomonas vancouverensis TaxID=95300 RepID=A0A1H2MK64_PSEVA|nr:response regulator transcription factor [Pseudomonas vancouverensis]KAB0494788.1 response regulator transcription factor [Pseudomonas vancouverensis]TDB63570.1 response regulator transcription factor [Pseudomonas vancouverensis]SDU93368.1 two component transcriptional regulator, LuxR family [Pseudomonas vancouverensis]